MIKRTTKVNKLPKGEAFIVNEDIEYFKKKLEKSRAKEIKSLTGYSRVGRNNV